MSRRCWMAPQFAPVGGQIRVVLPACPMDAHLMLANLDWQEELDGRKDWDCVLAIDGATKPDLIRDLEIAAWRTYSQVQVYVYPTAPYPVWPNGANWAFQHAAKHMKPGGRSWFWMESDCMPLRPDWLVILNQEYHLAGKPIMGAIVKGMGHCNGTAVYPPHFPDLCPAAMKCTETAWDGLMKKDTIHLTHNASHVICHVWGIDRGRARPFGGAPAHFNSWSDVERWVDLKAALFHRAKDTSLINQLRAHYDYRHTDRDAPAGQALAGVVP